MDREWHARRIETEAWDYAKADYLFEMTQLCKPPNISIVNGA